jgi:phospholipid/cholesterol/gamma-HCH transport system substrate-binding protein
MSLRRQVGRYGKWLVAIAFLVVVGAASGAFILAQERFSSPFANRYTLHAQFTNVSGLTPGLGQPVNVAGVRVGEVLDANVQQGDAVVTMSIDPAKLPHVYADATATLAPNTPLEDMEVDLDPGLRSEPPLASGATIAQSHTDVPPNYDDLTRTLDADTRDYFGALVDAADRGLRGQGTSLRRAFRALGPTTAQVRQISHLLAGRRLELQRVVHNLGTLSQAAQGTDHDLARVVSAGDLTLHALASQDSALSDAVGRLPGTTRLASRTFVDSKAFAQAMLPTLHALSPAIRQLPSGLRANRSLLDRAVPLIRASKPVLRQAVPLERDLSSVATGLRQVSPDIGTAFKVLDYAANELSFNPRGSDEGYLYWFAWAAHNLDSVVSVEDAHGAAAHGLALVSCQSAAAEPGLQPLILLITGQLPTC